jgi:hypothetical protein
MPLAIYGNRWQRAKEWETLRPYWRGPGLHNDDDYAKAVQGAKVCIGLLSKGNRDSSTTRSFEIPHLGAPFCAERTEEHLELYTEGEEALFWDNAEECAAQCSRLMNDEPLRTRIAAAGRARCLRNGTTNEVILGRILARALQHEEAPVVGA